MSDAPAPCGPPYIQLAELRRRGRENGVITAWIGSEARAAMRVRVKHLARIPRAEWDIKHFRHLKGICGCTDVYELKWKAEKKEFRVAGYNSPTGYFVMVFGFTHKGNVYDPPGWKDSIRTNRNSITDGSWEIVEFRP